MTYIKAVFSVPGTKAYTYALPEQSKCNIGYRIVAQLGRRNLTGYVTELTHERPPGDFEIKTVTKI